MSRRADTAKIRQQLTTTRRGEDAGTYRVLRHGDTTPWKVSRNDNELDAGGNRALAWQLVHDQAGMLHEDSTRGECLDDLAKRFAGAKPLRTRY